MRFSHRRQIRKQSQRHYFGVARKLKPTCNKRQRNVAKEENNTLEQHEMKQPQVDAESGAIILIQILHEKGFLNNATFEKIKKKYEFD